MKRRVLSTFATVILCLVIGANAYLVIALLVLNPKDYHDIPYFSIITGVLAGVGLTIGIVGWINRRRGKTIQRNERMSKLSLLVITALVVIMVVIYLIITLVNSFR